MKNWMVRGVMAAALVIGALQGQAHAQTASTVEALGFVGGVTDGGGTTFGGGMQFGLNNRVIVAAEVGYLTLGDDFDGFGADVNSSAISIDLNAHYLFASSNAKVKPYLLGGLGVIRSSATIERPSGNDTTASDTDAGLNLGGGLRVDLNDSWGVRPEVKFLVKDNTSTRITIGVYYRFGK